jgi:adenosine deaminase
MFPHKIFIHANCRTIMTLDHLPKVELHLHLDCSLSFELVQKLRPQTSWEEYRQSFVAPPKCTDLADYIKRAISALEILQTEESLRLAVRDLFQQLQADNVIYAEMRFAPLQHLNEGLSAYRVVEIVESEVAQQVELTGVKAGVILCTLRHYSEDQSLETARLVHEFKGTKVVGFDIAADEAGFPIDAHIPAFKYARENQLSCTAHAGEARGADSVWETLENFRPSRIGHGVRSAEDPELLQYLKDQNIHLEVCATSNIQTDIFRAIEDHNLDFIYNSGVSMSVNTDCRTISDVSLNSEYQLINKVFNWAIDHFYRCNCEAVKHAFTDDDTKRQLLSILKKAYA